MNILYFHSVCILHWKYSWFRFSVRDVVSSMQMELCIMLLECCSQERTYLRYYGLLGQRFCMINRIHQENFEKCFVQQYSMIHRLETNKLRNVAKFFAHLLGTDALPWHVLAYIRLTEEDTTSSSRIFIKILFQVLLYINLEYLPSSYLQYFKITLLLLVSFCRLLRQVFLHKYVTTN